MPAMIERPATFSEQILGFAVPSRDARGRLVRLDGLLDEILSAHAYPAPIAHFLAEALVVTALIGSLVKGEGSQVTMQARGTDAAISLLVCDYRDGNLRGYVDFDADRMASLGTNPALSSLFGGGYLALTFDVVLPLGDGATGETRRYQGIVPLEGRSIGEAVESYFFQSEQVPTLIRIAVSGEGARYRAAGMLVQHLPEGEEGRERLHVKLDHPAWEHVAILAGSIKHGELLDPGLSLKEIVWRLFNEEQEVRVFPGQRLGRGCRCSVDHYQTVLSRFSEDDRKEMRDDNGNIVVDCAFCSQQFAIAV